ncbi:MAG: DUF6240 domain-containing protein [Clostridium sp.]|nr:DUF6240 domain-containing protein [Clostridium sp.]
MTNMIDNNLMKAEAAYTKGRETGVKDKSVIDAFPTGRADEINGYVYDGKEADDKRGINTADNFADYLDAQRERAKEKKEDVRSKEEQDKEAAKELRNNLSSEEIKKLKMMGIDIEGATLSDLMGVINTMRGNAHREETAQLFADMKADSGDMEGLNIVGGSVKVAGTDIKTDVSVADVVAEKSKEEQAPDFDITNNELVYLIKNNLGVSRENIYKAHYSGSRQNDTQGSGVLVEQMRQQIDRAIEQAGYEPSPESYKAAHFMMDNQLAVTPDTIKKYMEFQDLVGQSVKEADMPVDDEEAVDLMTEELYTKTNAITTFAVYELAMEDKEITISAAYAKTMSLRQQKAKPKYKAEELNRILQAHGEDGTEAQRKAVTAIRQMEEIRLSMTMSMAGRLAKMNISIDTKELSKVVDTLKQIENQMIEEKLGTAATPENVELYKTLNEHMETLAESHMGVLGTPLKGVEFTVRGLYDAGAEANFPDVQEDAGSTEAASFEKVRRSYEAVGTAPRSDMGDSITKAFSNVDDIIADLGFEVNVETQRAVKILGYNSISITPENINQVMEYDRQVNELMDAFYPEAVLGAIKDGINPLDVPIDELVDMVRAHNYNAGITEAENFATYLMDVEKQGSITKEERESYIGIYRAMDKLAKSKDREAGWIFANGSRLTVRNLISAMRSRRTAGISFGVDDSFGALESGGIENSITDQIESAFHSIEKFNSLDKAVERYIEENQIEYSMTNAFAVDTMLKSAGGIYQMVSEIMEKLKFSTNVKDEMIDDETENMAKSLSGEEIDIAFTMESILEQIENRSDISLTYDDIRNRITELMYSAGAAGIITAADISAIKTVNAGLNIASRMAKNDKYQIPVDTKEGVKVMNLTIKSGQGDRGSISIFIEGNEMDTVSARVSLVNENTLAGYIESATSEGSLVLSGAAEDFNAQMRQLGFNTDRVRVGTGITKSQVREEFTGDGRVIYSAATAMVKSIANILK